MKPSYTGSIILPALLLRKEAFCSFFLGEANPQLSGDMTVNTEDNSEFVLKLACVTTAWLQFAVAASLDSQVFGFFPVIEESSQSPEL